MLLVKGAIEIFALYRMMKLLLKVISGFTQKWDESSIQTLPHSHAIFLNN